LSFAARQQVKTTRPPRLSAPRRLAKAPVGSAKNITPKRETSASNDAGAKTWVAASARMNAIGDSGDARRRAASSIGPETSRPTARPLGPTRRAISIVVPPPPHPTSRTRSPAASRARSNSASVIGANTTSCLASRSSQRRAAAPFQNAICSELSAVSVFTIALFREPSRVGDHVPTPGR
jgi:hypothetical protein